MMRFFLLILSVFFGVIQLATQSYAAITWQASVKEATDSNLELSAARNALLSSTYKVDVSRSGFLPQVNGVLSYSHDSTDKPKNYTTELIATENLFSGFSDTSKFEQAKYFKSTTEANLESIKAKISFDLKTAFMGLIYSQKYIILTEDITKRREANVKLVQLRFENGRENIGSLHLSKAYLAQAKYDHLQAMNSLEVYQSQLARVLGIDDTNSLEVSGTIPTQNPPYESNQNLDYKKLVKDIPDFKKAFYNEKITKSSIALNNSAFYPSLNLTQSLSNSGRNINFSKNTWALGASLTFPFFNGGKDYFNYKSVMEDYRASVKTTKNTEDTSVTNLKQAYTAYVEAAMKLEVDQAFLLAANSRERIAKAQYNNGLISFIDWDNIENDLIFRQKTLLQSERQRIIAEASWEQAQGRGVIP